MTDLLPRIYLDLDGVVYPTKPLDALTMNDTDIDMLHEHEWWRKSIVERLSSLSVEIVIASTWGVSFVAQLQRRSPLNVIKPTRALEIGYFSEHRQTKEVAVAEDLNNSPAPFIWIDDGLGQTMIDFVKQQTQSVFPGMYVAPYKQQGLTHDEVTAIQKGFLDQL